MFFIILTLLWFLFQIYRVCSLACSSRYVCCQTTLLQIFPRLSSFGKTQTIAHREKNIFDVDVALMFNHALNLTAKHSPAFLTLGLLVLDRPAELFPKLARLFAVIQAQLQNATYKLVVLITCISVYLQRYHR